MKPIFLVICLLLLNACSSLPPTIENPPAFDLAYSYASQDSARYKNVPVRWGGVIVEVENEQHASFVQVLLYPLGSYGRPQLYEPAQGRFVIKSTDFLDPLVYVKNTEITVAGTLNGTIDRSIGKKTLPLPLVTANTIHLWPAYNYNNNYYGYGGYGGYYGGYGGFGYGGFGYYSPYYYNYMPYGGWRGGYYPYWW